LNQDRIVSILEGIQRTIGVPRPIGMEYKRSPRLVDLEYASKP
jgi:hypothetical protein